MGPHFRELMKSLKNRLVYAYCALSDESCYGVLTQIRADRGQEWYKVNGREYTHVRRPSIKEIQQLLGSDNQSIFKNISEL